MVFTIIATLIILYSLINFRKGFFLYLLFQMFWFPQGKIISVEGLPSIPIYLYTSLAFAIIYLYKFGNKKRKAIRFPFFIPLLFMTLSRFLSCFSAVSGFSDQFARSIGFLFHDFIEVWIMWQIIETESDFKYIFKWLRFICLLACIYGMFEYLQQYNPLTAYKSTLTEQGINVYVVNRFRGYRLTSFFEHPIGAGMTLGLFAVFLIWQVVASTEGKQLRVSYIIIAVMCILCVLLTKMRAGVLFSAIAALSIIKPQKRRTYFILIAGLIALVLLFPLYKDSIDIVLSIFNESARESVGGSNLSMRLSQFDAVYRIMKLSPITGLGDQFSTYISSSYLIGTFGFESVWFEEMAKHGWVGIISTLVMIIYSVIIVPKKYKSKECFLISFAYWVTYTLTSVPFFRMSLYYYVLFYYIKHSSVYQAMKSVTLAKPLSVSKNLQVN